MAVRVLAQAAVSFLLGIVAARYGRLWGYGLCAAWLLAVGAMALWPGEDAKRRRLPSAFLRVGVCLLLCCLGQLRYESQQEAIETASHYLTESRKVTAAGCIYKKEEKDQQVSYYLRDSYIMCEAGTFESGRILIYSNTGEFSIGDTISVTGTGECFAHARNQGNFDSRNYYYSKNIFCRIWADQGTLVERPAFLWREALYRLRKELQEVYKRLLPRETAGVLSVMTSGDKGLLDVEVKKLYQQSGISHVLAISGLHVSILGAGVYRFLRKRGLSYLWSGAVSGTLVFLFGQLSGMELSTERAVVMFLVMLLGNAVGMAYDSVTALALAAFLQLWENPLCLWYAGFLFSYSAVLAVVVAVRILEESLKSREPEREKKLAKAKCLRGRVTGWKGELKNTFLVSACIQLVTLPLTVYFYYEFPLYGVVINGLLLPFMGVVLMSGILGGLAGVLAGALAGVADGTFKLMLEGLAFLLLRPAYFLLQWNQKVCRLFEGLPGAMQIAGQPETWMMIAYYVILVVALWLLHGRSLREGEGALQDGGRTTERRARAGKGAGTESSARAGKGAGTESSARTGRRSRTERGAAFGIYRAVPLAAVLGALLILVFYRPNLGLHVCFLDVGQGDGIYIQAENGNSFFIDGGSTDEKQVGEYRILPFLKCRGVGKIDGWFVSHADKDHISGLKEVWERGYPIGHLFLSRWISRDEAWEELCRLAGQYGTEVIYLKEGDAVGSGGLTFTCLYPWQEEADRNDASMVLYMDSPNLTAIFGGDISTGVEKRLAERYRQGQVDLYKASHHGSDGSNSDALLSVLQPGVAVVSCARKNSYGHPGAEAMERIEAQGSQIFYTMEGGQITVGGDEKGIWVREFVR